MISYIIFTPDEFELPVACLSTLKECAEWLNVSRETLKTALRRHGKYCGKKYSVERVYL